MAKSIARTVLPMMLAAGCIAAPAQAAPPPPVGTVVPASRGQALYDIHCIACHNTQVHWRDDRKATDWASLKAQVRRWQDRAGLGWSEAEIVEVTRYLNDAIYHYAPTSDLLGRLAPR
jgi:mono/diheme cytochrome c family protein